jgi:hypothetical protein
MQDEHDLLLSEPMNAWVGGTFAGAYSFYLGAFGARPH